ncbi:MAG: FAD-dependent oxidoreductase [Acidimicrobiia bacterium]|nr:FAD-dependent oxidoreductase [Acidimicrobiia bacterium]
MRIIVVGGGIGGLAAAVGLRRAGHDVVVLERAPRIDPAGAGSHSVCERDAARSIASGFEERGRTGKAQRHPHLGRPSPGRGAP